MEKTCSKCKQSQPLTADHFHYDRHSKDGFTHQCKACRYPPLYDVPFPDGYRACTKCLTLKAESAEFFVRNKTGRGGLSEQCKACNQAYRLAHKQKLIEYARSYRKENNEELKRKQRTKSARPETKSHRLEYDRENRQRIRENSREWAQQWRTQNREAWRIRKRVDSMRRRSLKSQAEGKHTTADVERQYKSQKGKCYWCGVKVGKDYHVDHIVPLARGGSNWPENIVVSCPFCNTSKGDKLPHEWPIGGRLL